MMHLEGAATIENGPQVSSVDVSLDLAQGRCLISENGTSSTGGLLGLFLATIDKVFLGNVRLRAGDSEFLAETLGPFFLSSSTQAEPSEDKDVSGSGLAIALGINPNVVGVNEVELRPFSSKLDFQVIGYGMTNDSEIFFYCDPRANFDCTVEIDGEEVRVHTFHAGTVLSKYVRCFSSSLDLSRYTRELRIAVSLFLRRRAFLHFVRVQSRVSLNLSPPDQAISYGVLVHNPRHYEEVLGRLAAASSRLKWHFLIEAFSNPFIKSTKLTL